MFRKIIYRFRPTRTSQKLEQDPQFKRSRRQELLYNMGIYSAAFGLAWGAVPFYKLFCEHFGLDGNLEKKDYSMKGKKLDRFKKYAIQFKSEVDPEQNWDFHPVQHQVRVHAGETALIFYRAYNKNDKPIVGIQIYKLLSHILFLQKFLGFSTYQVFPEDASLYFSKIQCFCFNQQLLNPQEELMLPIYFYLEPEIVDDPVCKKIGQITIVYRFFKSRNQDLAKLAEQELKTVRRNKLILSRIRQKQQEGQLDENELKSIKSALITDEELEQFDDQ